MLRIWTIFAAAGTLAASSAVLGQSSFGVPGPQGEAVVSVVGKFTSVYGTDAGSGALPTYPATVSVASLPVPAKHKSKSKFLLINTAAQVLCPGDSTATVVTVDGVPIPPDPTSTYFFDCQNSNGYQSVAHTWFVVPESAGGPTLTSASMIDVRMTSGASAATFGGVVAVTAQTTK